MNQLDTMIERDVASSAGTVDMGSRSSSFPFPTSIARSASTATWAGDSMPTSWSVTRFGASNSRLQVRRARSSSAPRARRLPGSARGHYLVVSDIQSARARLVDRGVDVSEVFHRDGPGQPAVNGPHPERRSYLSYATFSDPDGNEWLLQEVTTRFPGRIDSTATSFASVSDLASAMRRASVAEHEKRIGAADPNWPQLVLL